MSFIPTYDLLFIYKPFKHVLEKILYFWKNSFFTKDFSKLEKEYEIYKKGDYANELNKLDEFY